LMILERQNQTWSWAPNFLPINQGSEIHTRSAHFSLLLKRTGQCNFSIVPCIYHFLICYISFSSLKNFGSVILHLYSHNIHKAGNVYVVLRNTHSKSDLRKNSKY
jgi:hypothetical protein